MPWKNSSTHFILDAVDPVSHLDVGISTKYLYYQLNFGVLTQEDDLEKSSTGQEWIFTFCWTVTIS